jgi:hypothetical protein
MELTLTRTTKTNNSTIGELTDNVNFNCYTLEPVDRGLLKTMSEEDILLKKVYGKTAIPAGRYRIFITFSDHFKKNLPMLAAVPGFQAVEIHTGNTAADTRACILIGYDKDTDTIMRSGIAFADLMLLLTKAEEDRERNFITIQ